MYRKYLSRLKNYAKCLINYISLYTKDFGRIENCPKNTFMMIV